MKSRTSFGVSNLVMRSSFFVILLLILFSCHRTNKDKFVIDSYNIYLFELESSESESIDFKIGKEASYQSIKKLDTVLLFIIFNKKFIQSHSNSNVPFEGMAGANDSVFSLEILNTIDLIVDSSIINLSNSEYINDIPFTKTGHFMEDTVQISFNYFKNNWNFERIISNYNNNKFKKWFGTSKFAFPLLIKKQELDKFLHIKIHTSTGVIPPLSHE